jgi:hypothetical protein
MHEYVAGVFMSLFVLFLAGCGSQPSDAGRDEAIGETSIIEVENLIYPDVACTEEEVAFINGEAGYATVSQAVAIAAKADVVSVCAGDHSVNLVIDVNLILEGVEGAAETALVASLADSVVVIEDAHVTLNGFTIRGGVAERGGGVNVVDGGLDLTSSRITQNHADKDGGGVYGFNSSVTVEHCEFDHNTASEDGGGVFVDETDGPVKFTDVVVKNNEAGNGGGLALLMEHALKSTVPDTVAVLQNVSVFDNGAFAGAGIFAAGHLKVTDSEVRDNDAEAGGGGLYLETNSALLKDTMVNGNRSADTGGGLVVHGGDQEVQCKGSTAIEDNRAEWGAGVDIFANDSETPATLIGCRVHNNTGTWTGGVEANGPVALVRLEVTSNHGGTVGGINSVGAVEAEDLKVHDNVAESGHGGISAQLRLNTEFAMSGGSVLRNTGSVSGGIHVFGGQGLLVAENVDMGKGSDDNVPVDVQTRDEERDYGQNATFSCDPDRCY